MPVIDGKVVRSRYTKLDLGELSCVDRPAQPGALAAIMKRDDSGPNALELMGLAKYVSIDDGAHTFVEVLRENQFSEKIWPFTDALSQSIRSIVGDKRLTGDEREAKINESVASFLTKVREISPEVAKQLEALVNKKDGPMPKSIEQLEADLAKVQGDLESTTSKLATATAQVTTLTARAEKAEGELAAAKEAGGELATVKAELVTTKAALAAATEEVIKVGETEIKKSVVGDAQFEMAKAIATERDLAVLEKRAGQEFGHVTGTDTEKAKVIQLIEGCKDDATKAAGLAILTAAEKMGAGAFDQFGGNKGLQPTEKQAQATEKFNAEVRKNEEAGMKPYEAMSKARRDNPTLFAEMNGDEPAVAAQ